LLVIGLLMASMDATVLGMMVVCAALVLAWVLPAYP
jgi:urea transporter